MLARAFLVMKALLIGAIFVLALAPAAAEAQRARSQEGRGQPETTHRGPSSADGSRGRARARVGRATRADRSSRAGRSEGQSARRGRRPVSAHAASRRRARRGVGDLPEAGVGSISIGRPGRGRLVRGVALEPSEHLAVKSSSHGQHFGTAELVSLLGRVAARVAERSPGARLHVGDLSREGGGRFGPHRSHRSGRDADVGLYLVGADGQPVMTERFYDIRRDGTATQDPTVRLDEGRTWELLEALVADTETPVQFIFLAPHLEERLLAEGRRRGASEELLARIDAVVDAERRHTNHMHVRIYCPVDDVPRCDEEPPYHPWVDRSQAAVARAAERRPRPASQGRRRGARGVVRVSSARASRGGPSGASPLSRSSP
jgi:penicillin-insensitive murein endopeptidase